MTPDRVACPKCARQPGEACDFSDRLFAGPPPDFHAERIEAAAMCGEPAIGVTPSAKDFEAAVEASGLV